MKLLKNLVLVDDSHPLNLHKVDILIEKDTIIDIKEEIDLKNIEIIKYNHEYVSPGWIDIHTHIYEGVTDISVDADRIGVNSGVVLLCDAGSSGEATIDDFYNLVKNKKTIVKSWINIAST
jgi:predicted amidohydrolase